MTRIESYGSSPWSDDSDGAHVPSARGPARRDLPGPDLPDWGPDLSGFVLASRERAAGTSRADAASDAATVDADRAARIRDFFDQLNVPISSRGGRVPIPFRINSSSEETAAYAGKLRKEFGKDPAARFVDRVVTGRGTPAQIRAVVAALDRRKPDLFVGSVTHVQGNLLDYGIGIDCAGSVQLALFASRGLDENSGPPRFNFRDRSLDNFSSLGQNRAFARVSNPANLRPGDLIVMGPPPGERFGHKVIVVSQQQGTLANDDASHLDPPASIPAGRSVVLIQLASSWGYGDGPGQHTWAYDPSTGAWASVGMGSRVDGHPMGHTGSGPWNHPLQGMYHAR